MDEETRKDLEDLSERDRKRLMELRRRRDDGTLSYTEKIELELLESQEALARIDDQRFMAKEEREGMMEVEVPEEEGTEEEEGDYERLRKAVLDRTRKPQEELEEFEELPAEHEEEPRKSPRSDADPEKVKMAIAFGAGAMMGYFFKEFLEEEFDDEED